MGKIATIGEIQAAFGLTVGSEDWPSDRCPTRGDLSTIWGDQIEWIGDSGYASNRLVELDMVSSVDIEDPEGDTFTIRGISGQGYSVFHDYYEESGEVFISPIELIAGQPLSDGSTFSFGQRLFVRNIQSGIQEAIPALSIVPGGSVTVDSDIEFPVG